MPFEIVHQDLTKMNTEAIVNAANQQLQMGGGVCGAIFKAAGARELQKACDEIGSCRVGQAVLTKGFNLPASYIIHTVGPVWRGGHANEVQQLAEAYRNALVLAKENGIGSIAFPLISSGVYGYPKEEALHIAITTIGEFLSENDMDVYLVVYDRKAVSISEKLFTEINHYIDTYYEDVDICRLRNVELECNYSSILDMDSFELHKEHSTRHLEDLFKNMEETFTEMLLRLIDEKGKTDVEVYKKANMDRKLFSKIRSNKDYQPKKATVLALAIGLELSLDETQDLLMKAGYSLSMSQKFDVIIQYFIENKQYDIFTINETLFCFNQSLLGK